MLLLAEALVVGFCVVCGVVMLGIIFIGSVQLSEDDQ